MRTTISTLFMLFVLGQVFSQNMTVISDSTQTELNTAENKKKEKQPYTGKRTFIGGGLGMSFGRDYGFFNGSVLMGYNITKRLQAAGKFSYWYAWGRAQTPNRKGSERYENSIYAFSVPVRFVLWKGLFLHAEPEYMNQPAYNWVTDASSSSGYTLQDHRIDEFNFYVGGGAYLHFTGNSGPYFQVLWNLNEKSTSFYSNPYWQVGYSIGF
ncbi:MAG: hypothetical protein ACPGEG_07035 [Salibacteraceae bacterium]